MAATLRERWIGEPSAWRRAAVVLLALAVVLFLALAVTGIVLSVVYAPSASHVFGDAVARSRGTSGLQTAHRVLSTLLFWTGFGLLVSGLGLAVERHRVDGNRRAALVTGGLPLITLLAVVLATYTGYLIAWDLIALSAVTVGPGYDGVWAAAFDDGVHFVLVDGFEVSQSTFARGVIAHVVVVPLLVLAAGVTAGRRLTRPGPPVPELAPDAPELV